MLSSDGLGEGVEVQPPRSSSTSSSHPPVMNDDANGRNLESALGFASVSHSFSLMSKQVEVGLTHSKRIAEYLQKICKAKQTYAQELFKATSGELNRKELAAAAVGTATAASTPSTAPIITEDREAMVRCTQTFSDLKENIFEEAQQEQEFATKVLSEVVNPLLAFYQQADNKRKLILEHERSLTNQVKGVTEALLKAKINCLKLMEAVKSAEEKEKEEIATRELEAREAKINPITSPTSKDANKKSVSSSFNTFFSKFKGAAKKEKKEGAGNLDKNTQLYTSEDWREKAYSAALSYALAVQSANQRQRQYYLNDLPNVFTEMERIEIARLDTLKDLLGKLAAGTFALTAPNNQRTQSFVQSVQNMDTKQDVDGFIASLAQSVGSAQLPNEYSYELPFSPDQIRSAHIDYQAPSEDSDSLFGSSLAHLMSKQASSSPHLAVPEIVHALIQAIREMGGIRTKELFRQSPNKDELMALRRQFESGDLTLHHTSNPDLPASLLKQWLRDLPESLIPPSHYNEAIELAKKHENIYTPIAMSKIGEFVQNLPSVNRSVLQEIASLVIDISNASEDRHQTLSNLAVVFAPTILHNPSTDAVELLVTAKYESRLTSGLFQCLGDSHSTTSGSGSGSAAGSSSTTSAASSAHVIHPESAAASLPSSLPSGPSSSLEENSAALSSSAPTSTSPSSPGGGAMYTVTSDSEDVNLE